MLSIHHSIYWSLVHAVCRIPVPHLHFITWWIGGRSHLTNTYLRLLLMGMMLLSLSSGHFCGVDVTPPWGSMQSHTWLDWLLDAHVASSSSSSSKSALPLTRMSWDNPEVCTKPTPHLAFTMPGKTLNASLCSSSRCSAVWQGIGISCTLTSAAPGLSRIACCFSKRFERCHISSDWDLISLAWHKCNWDNTNIWVWWTISSSIIWLIKLPFLEALALWLIPFYEAFSELTPAAILEASQHYVSCPLLYHSMRALAYTGLRGTGLWLLRIHHAS